MVPTIEKKNSSPSTVIKIVAGVHPAKNVEYFDENSKELEKANHEYKESSSTQTSSSSSLLYKRKSHSYYVTNRSFKPPGNCISSLWRRQERNRSAIPQRIISAKFLKVKQLQNELTEAQQKITDLLEENKTLKNIHKRQDSALKKYESQDSYLPQLMRSHEEELRVVTSKYKKLKTTHLDLEARYNKQHAELVALKERHKHLLQISKDKHLFQREHLTKQIEEMKVQINELKNKIKLQSRRLDLETKNHKHQLSVEMNKHRTLQDQLKRAQETIDQMQNALKDKERIIVNSKTSHFIPHKTTFLKSKLPLHPLKPLRVCSLSSEENKVNQSNMKNENESNSLKFINNVVGESLQIFDKDIENEPVNLYCEQNKSAIVSTRERQFENCFRENNSVTSSQKKSNVRSDDNNNIKQNSLDSNLSDPQTKETNDAKQIRNYSQNSFELYEKATFEETGSEKSEEEIKSPDDTVSWLEFHERITRANDDVNSKLDEFCDTMEPRQPGKLKSTRNSFEVQIFRKTNDQRNGSNRELSQDKKMALLTALSQIDEEKNDPNPFHSIFENVGKRNSSISVDKVFKT